VARFDPPDRVSWTIGCDGSSPREVAGVLSTPLRELRYAHLSKLDLSAVLSFVSPKALAEQQLMFASPAGSRDPVPCPLQGWRIHSKGALPDGRSIAYEQDLTTGAILAVGVGEQYVWFKYEAAVARGEACPYTRRHCHALALEDADSLYGATRR
jgi:hypothetical protein